MVNGDDISLMKERGTLRKSGGMLLRLAIWRQCRFTRARWKTIRRDESLYLVAYLLEWVRYKKTPTRVVCLFHLCNFSSILRPSRLLFFLFTGVQQQFSAERNPTIVIISCKVTLRDILLSALKFTKWVTSVRFCFVLFLHGCLSPLSDNSCLFCCMVLDFCCSFSHWFAISLWNFC